MNTQTPIQTANKPERLVIQGLTTRGQTFRPRNWAERLCGCMATVDAGHHEHYSPYVYVSFNPGVKSLVVERGLWETNPQGYDFLLAFAHDNNLKISEEDIAQSGLAMAVGK